MIQRYIEFDRDKVLTELMGFCFTAVPKPSLQHILEMIREDMVNAMCTGDEEMMQSMLLGTLHGAGCAIVMVDGLMNMDKTMRNQIRGFKDALIRATVHNMPAEQRESTYYNMHSLMADLG